MTLIWENLYAQNGTFYKFVVDSSNKFYVSGVTNNLSSVTKVNLDNGIASLIYYEDTLSYINSIPYDLRMNTNNIVLTGSKNNSNGSSDAFITVLDIQLDTILTFLGHGVFAFQGNEHWLVYLNTVGFTSEISKELIFYIGV